jgi:hypothetical protein
VRVAGDRSGRVGQLVVEVPADAVGGEPADDQGEDDEDYEGE